MLEVPIWVAGVLAAVLVAFGGWFGRLAYGEGSILKRRNESLSAELDRAEAKIATLRNELNSMEMTIQRLREDLQWERDENRRHRQRCRETPDTSPATS
jgi:cell division protein FtsB